MWFLADHSKGRRMWYHSRDRLPVGRMPCRISRDSSLDKPTRSQLNSIMGASDYDGGRAVGLRYILVQAGSMVESEVTSPVLVTLELKAVQSMNTIACSQTEADADYSLR